KFVVAQTGQQLTHSLWTGFNVLYSASPSASSLCTLKKLPCPCNNMVRSFLRNRANSPTFAITCCRSCFPARCACVGRSVLLGRGFSDAIATPGRRSRAHAHLPHDAHRLPSHN